MSFLLWLEQLPAGVWVREAPTLFAFPFILFLHTLGLAMLAGVSIGVDLWLLGQRAIGRGVRVAGFYHVMWLGFGINAVSGVALLLAYPAKALTNPVFYIKMLLVVLALVALQRIRTQMFASGRAETGAIVTRTVKLLAIGSLACWAGTIVTGRLLAYTHTVLLVSDSL